MRRIVQLEEDDYQRITKLAAYKEKRIQQEAVKLWKQKGAPTVRIHVSMHNRECDDVYELTSETYMYQGSEKFMIPEKTRRRFEEIINKGVMESIESYYGEVLKLRNHYAGELRYLRLLRYALYAVAASGWAAAAACFILK